MCVVENLQCSFPYKDWDEDEGKSTTKEEFQRRFQNTEIEMIWSQVLNIGVSMIMLFPLWFTGQLLFSILLSCENTTCDVFFFSRLQDKTETRPACQNHRCQGGGGGLPLRLQHPGHHDDCRHDCLLHLGGGSVSTV